MSLTVGIDARTVYALERRGTGKNLLDAYSALARLRPSWRFVMYHRGAASDDPFAAVPNIVSHQIDLRGDRLDLWEHLRLPWAAWRDGVDVLHCPANSAPIVSIVPLVCTVHDVIPLHLRDELAPGDRRRFRRRVRRAVRGRRQVITVSECSRRDIMEYLHVPSDRIRVIGWAPDSRTTAVEDPEVLAAVRARHGIEQPYVLALSGLSRRKNAAGLVQAYALVPEHVRQTTQLVIGGIEPLARRIRLQDIVARSGLADCCRVLGFIPEADLPALLSGAQLLACCSLYEGFGLPVLDAFRCRTAVLAGAVSAVPEVAGTAVEYCDPASPAAIAQGITRLLSDDRRRAELVAAGQARLCRFSWDATAIELGQVLERAARARRTCDRVAGVPC